MSKKEKVGGGALTVRDVAIVGWVGRHRVATAEQVARRFGMQLTKAYERLRVLRRMGLVRLERPVHGAGVVLATRAGLERSGVVLAPAKVALGTIVHDLAVVDVSIELEAKTGARVVTDRELRRDAGSAAAAAMVPDLVAELEGERLAVEVELTRKAKARVRAKLDRYAASSEFSQVVYFTADATTQRWLAQLVDGQPAARAAVRLLPSAVGEPQPPKGLEAEVRAFVRSSALERERMLAAWQARYRDERQAS